MIKLSCLSLCLFLYPSLFLSFVSSYNRFDLISSLFLSLFSFFCCCNNEQLVSFPSLSLMTHSPVSSPLSTSCCNSYFRTFTFLIIKEMCFSLSLSFFFSSYLYLRLFRAPVFIINKEVGFDPRYNYD